MSARTVDGPAPALRKRSTAATLLISVLTYRRPGDLAELLPMLDAHAAGCDLDVGIVVVDNDPEGSGLAVCAAAALPRVRYVHEPRPGIVAGRSRALVEASGRDLLIFIDDDERPGPDWLARLLDTFDAVDCSGVVGPVVSSFAAPLEPWIVAGGFFERRRLVTGAPVAVAATNNLLLDLRDVRAADVRFDERFGLSGGSDTLFTRQLTAAGCRLVWCDEAVVTDVVPADRATRDWVLRRRLRIGNSWSRTSLVLAGSAGARLRVRVSLAGQGAVRVAGGAARWALGTATGHLGHRAGGSRTAVRGAGMLAGALGYTYSEYRRRAG